MAGGVAQHDVMAGEGLESTDRQEGGSAAQALPPPPARRPTEQEMALMVAHQKAEKRAKKAAKKACPLNLFDEAPARWLDHAARLCSAPLARICRVRRSCCGAHA